MRLVLRSLAILVAVVGVLDPAVARRTSAPLAIDLRLPGDSHPEFTSADERRREVLASLGEDVEIGGATDPQAILAIGDATVADAGGLPVFFVPTRSGGRRLAIRSIDVPPRTLPGQAVRVTARIDASGVRGRKTSIRLQLRGAAIARVEHAWETDAGTFDAVFTFAPPSTGPHRLRVVATTEGEPVRAVADALVTVRERPLRVLAFDGRPSWPLTFVRRSLEADPMFEVAATSRSSRRVATTTGGAPARLAAMDIDRYDAVLVGALDELSAEDLRALDRFVTGRGGTLVLLPDRQMPEAVRRHFELPAAEEVLLERPIPLGGTVAAVRASELLLMPSDTPATTIAVASDAGGPRPAVVAFNRGEGQVVVSGLLDAYRFRLDADSTFDDFWRSVVADAARAARPPIDLRLSPAVARPGEAVRVLVDVRSTELRATSDGRQAPALSAELLTMAGERASIRLWPAPRAGQFEGTFDAPSEGGYLVRATGVRPVSDPSSVEVPLLVASDVVHPSQDGERALRYLAAATGGVVIGDPADAPAALASVEPLERDEVVRPMRSAWWILPFAALLCAEWTLRRRVGLK